MTRRSTKLFKAALSALHYSGADGLIAPFTAGNGVILMLHQVTPDAPQDFEPNRILKVTPDFLDSVIVQVRAAGFDIISMDDVPERIKGSQSGKPFAVFTLDDGYKDNREHAYPVFKRQGVPFTIYVASDFADGIGDLWWLSIEEAIRRLPAVTLEMDSVRRHFDLTTVEQKDAAFEVIYWWLRTLPENIARAVTHRLAREAEFDPNAFCRNLVMDWQEIKALAEDPLVTIGSHTCTHLALAKLSEAEVRREISDSIQRIEAELGRPCRHFSYPYGCDKSAGEREFAIARELGVTTAVTTRKGMLHASQASELWSLPRLSLNGDFQDARYVKVLLSGAPFAFWNAVQRFGPHREGPSQSY
ncbi:MAG: polysaccharide deacetylase family protein [Hyphomicrobium sp.]|nr:polysaccharide deacetylase family protein [Hyphomicrobium sp.]